MHQKQIALWVLRKVVIASTIYVAKGTEKERCNTKGTLKKFKNMNGYLTCIKVMSVVFKFLYSPKHLSFIMKLKGHSWNVTCM